MFPQWSSLIISLFHQNSKKMNWWKLKLYIYLTIYDVFTQSETLTRHITCIWQCLRWCFNMCELDIYFFIPDVGTVFQLCLWRQNQVFEAKTWYVLCPNLTRPHITLNFELNLKKCKTLDISIICRNVHYQHFFQVIGWQVILPQYPMNALFFFDYSV